MKKLLPLLFLVLVNSASAFCVRINNTLTSTNEVSIWVDGVLVDTIRMPGATTAGFSTALLGPYSDFRSGVVKVSMGFTPPLYAEATSTNINTWGRNATLIARMQGSGFGNIVLSYGSGDPDTITTEMLLSIVAAGFSLSVAPFLILMTIRKVRQGVRIGGEI